MSTTDARTADLLDPEWWVDLEQVHDFFTWARREAPVFRDEANGLWAVTRHADLLDVERRSDVFSSRGSYRANIAMDESNMIALDDPEHLAQRRLVNRRFTPRAVQQDARVPRVAHRRARSTPSPTRAGWRSSTTSPPSSPRGSRPTCWGSRRSAGRTSSRGPSG